MEKIADCRLVKQRPKHRYALPLDDAMRAQIAPLAKPYPKRPKEHAPAVQVGSGLCDSDPDAPSRTVRP